MGKKFYIIFGIIILMCIFVITIVYFINKNMVDDKEGQSNIYTNDIGNETINNEKEDYSMSEIIIKVNGKELNVKLENNTSATAFAQKLKDGDITINANDYANFEKVGSLGFDLITNDENIKAKAGDLILYQGNQITLYYDTNSWYFTKLGKVQNISKNELKSILGDGDVILTFSLKS